MLNQVNTFKVCYFRGKYVEQLQLRSELKEQTVVFILSSAKYCKQTVCAMELDSAALQFSEDETGLN